MKLTDPWFEAEFIGHMRANAFQRLGASIEGAQGVFLYSPCHVGETVGAHGLVIPFANPRHAPSVPPEFLPRPRWQMHGSGLHDLTLTPSIDCTVDDPEHAARRARLRASALASADPGGGAGMGSSRTASCAE